MTAEDQESRRRNTRANLVRTLEDFSSRERLLKYKAAVPFVHVPRELFARWEEYARFLKEGHEFIATLNEAQQAAMLAFDGEVAAFDWKGRLPDVPEILEMNGWIALMEQARRLLAALRP